MLRVNNRPLVLPALFDAWDGARESQEDGRLMEALAQLVGKNKGFEASRTGPCASVSGHLRCHDFA